MQTVQRLVELSGLGGPMNGRDCNQQHDGDAQRGGEEYPEEQAVHDLRHLPPFVRHALLPVLELLTLVDALNISADVHGQLCCLVEPPAL